MITIRIMVVALLIVGSGLALHTAWAQQSGSKRTDLQRNDLSAPGREVVQVRVERSTRRKTSAAPTRRNSPRISSKKGSRSSCWSVEGPVCDQGLKNLRQREWIL
jgi:hypothetical protein